MRRNNIDEGPSNVVEFMSTVEMLGFWSSTSIRCGWRDSEYFAKEVIRSGFSKTVGSS